ncbi:MAG: DUF134 domain-containing protein [Candidatus Diapherotrites archaeon]|nr:DUF134 domain-containing protein [Candidatus Diapherotrites archaeon]
MAGRRGRPRSPVRITFNYSPREFYTADATEFVVLDFSELEAMRLVDLQGLTTEAAAQRMGVSKTTVWRLLSSARRKLCDAVVNGKRIVVKERTVSPRKS